MKLTAEQRRAVKATGNTLLRACPGSGKTRAIIAKLLRCIDDLRESSRKVACLTYTNAAVEEIEDRLRIYGSMDDEEYCDISTIHTFCLANVLGHFHWRIPCYRRGLTVLPPEDVRFEEIAIRVLREHNLSPEIALAFGEMNRRTDGSAIVPTSLTEEVAGAFWEALESEGFIDFPSIVYRSYELLAADPSLVKGLASRFAWILVDEFQDTSELQVEILKLIADFNLTRFFLVGDRSQSIYRFVGASPALMDAYSTYIEASDDYHLVECFRCSSRIITHAERLLPRIPRMRLGPGVEDCEHDPFHIDGETSFSAIVEYFIPVVDEMNIPYGKCAILAPAWHSLYHLGRQLREFGIPVHGIGARPYGRVHFFGGIAEHVCAYISDPSPEKISAIEKQLFILVTQLSNRRRFEIFSYMGKVTVHRLLRAGAELAEAIDGGMEWLEAAAIRFGDILTADGWLPGSLSSTFSQSVADMRAEMIKRRLDVANLTVQDLGLFASPDDNLKLLTIHRAKGKEFDAVAIVGLHEGMLPHRNDDADPEGFEESKRKFYVAITRARKVLMYVTDRGNARNRPSRFLSTVLDQ